MEEDEEEEENELVDRKPSPLPITVCKCLIDGDSSEKVEISERKQMILSTVSRSENYLRTRRIPELIRFLMTKLLTQDSDKPIFYLESLLDECMLFRAGHGVPPVLYEDRHLAAVVKSFDPGQRGWLTAGQIRRMYTTLGLTPEDFIEERVPCDIVLKNLKRDQEAELLSLLSAGMDVPESTETSQTDSITQIK